MFHRNHPNITLLILKLCKRTESWLYAPSSYSISFSFVGWRFIFAAKSVFATRSWPRNLRDRLPRSKPRGLYCSWEKGRMTQLPGIRDGAWIAHVKLCPRPCRQLCPQQIFSMEVPVGSAFPSHEAPCAPCAPLGSSVFCPAGRWVTHNPRIKKGRYYYIKILQS